MCCAARPEFLQRLVDGGAGDDGAAQGVGDEVEEHEAADEAVLEGFGTGVGGYFAGGGEFGGGGHVGWCGLRSIWVDLVGRRRCG